MAILQFGWQCIWTLRGDWAGQTQLAHLGLQGQDMGVRHSIVNASNLRGTGAVPLLHERRHQQRSWDEGDAKDYGRVPDC